MVFTNLRIYVKIAPNHHSRKSQNRGHGMKYFAVPDGTPAFHQALEQIVFEQIQEDSILMLWSNAPAIVCGAYQNIYQETSVYRAWKRGIPVIRRDSGGGTVYHDPGNLNYTVICDSDGSVNYDGVMAGILTALHRIGVPAEKSKVCDITLHGRKISGGRLLHHGTLLFDTDLTVLHEVSGRSGRTYHSRAIPSNPAQVVNISQYWQGTMADFRKALRAAYPADLTEASLTEEQLRLAEQLAEEKYGSWAWTCGRSPAFLCEVTGELSGKPIQLRYEAKKGVITVCELRSPLLDPHAGDRFLGAQLRPEAIEALCQEITDEPDKLAELIL